MSQVTLNATLSLNAYERTPVTVADYEVYFRISFYIFKAQNWSLPHGSF